MMIMILMMKKMIMILMKSGPMMIVKRELPTSVHIEQSDVILTHNSEIGFETRYHQAAGPARVGGERRFSNPELIVWPQNITRPSISSTCSMTKYVLLREYSYAAVRLL